MVEEGHTIKNIATFYIALILLLGLFSISSDEIDEITIPSYPDIPNVTDFPVLSLITGFVLFFVEFIVFIFVVLGFLFNIVKFSVTGLLPSWLNIMIFSPLALTIGWEIAKFVRGIGSS